MIDIDFEIGHLENGIWFPNQASDDSRIDIKFCIKNNSPYIIKCIEPEFVPIGKNKKIVCCKLFDYNKRIMTIRRLIYPNQVYCSFFENMWYNENIFRVYLIDSDVTYIKNKYETIPLKKISFISN